MDTSAAAGASTRKPVDHLCDECGWPQPTTAVLSNDHAKHCSHLTENALFSSF